MLDSKHTSSLAGLTSSCALSRRALMAGAAVSVLAGPAVAAPNTDATLLDLGRRLSDANGRWEATLEALDDLRDQYVEPTSPEALFRRPSDSMGFGAGAVRRDGRLWLGADVANIRAMPCGWSCEDPDGIVRWHADSRSEARRNEIVAAGAEFEAAKAAAREACGLTAAETEHQSVVDLAQDLRREIIATPAATLAGVMVKARAAGWIFGGIDGLDGEIEMEADAQGETMMFALLRDLLRLADPST